jgi:hypothetical protein
VFRCFLGNTVQSVNGGELLQRFQKGFAEAGRAVQTEEAEGHKSME